MFAWLRELLEIRAEFQSRKLEIVSAERQDLLEVCNSCETLKSQLEIANYEKKVLLDKLLQEPTIPLVSEAPVEISRPKTLPWRVKRQLLEQEDRERARLMREAPKPETIAADIADLERELDVAELDRENTVK